MNKIVLIIIFGVCLYLFSYCCNDEKQILIQDNQSKIEQEIILNNIKQEIPNVEQPVFKPINDPRIILDTTTIEPDDSLSTYKVDSNPEMKIIQIPIKGKRKQSNTQQVGNVPDIQSDTYSTPDNIIKIPQNKLNYNETNLMPQMYQETNIMPQMYQETNMSSETTQQIKQSQKRVPVPMPQMYQESNLMPQMYQETNMSSETAQQIKQSQERVPVPMPKKFEQTENILSTNNELAFEPKPVNDYKIPKKSFEEKYWDINNNKFSLLENSILTNGKFFSGFNDILAPEVASGGLKTGYPSECNPIISENSVISKDSDYPPKVLIYNGNDYKMFGLASNKYYNIYFIVYEREVYFDEPNIYNNKLYEYVLVKLVNNKLQIMHSMQPRTRIVMGDYVSFNFGVSQLNFLLVTPL